MVSQDAHLVADSVADNIRLWDVSISDEQVQGAARVAAIHDDIMRMEGGYQHQLAERGRNLSGGQRQRIEIARALAKKPARAYPGRSDERARCPNRKPCYG